jgi:hypothetical protein
MTLFQIQGRAIYKSPQTAVWRAPILGRKFVTRVGSRVRRVYL